MLHREPVGQKPVCSFPSESSGIALCCRSEDGESPHGSACATEREFRKYSMAHEVRMDISSAFVTKTDVTFDIRENGSKLGTLLV
jgi:hypothetical protein